MFFSGIGDEAGSDIITQVKAHKQLGWDYIELRLIDGENVAGAVSDQKFDEIYRVLEENEMRVSAFASAIANWSRHINNDFNIDLNELKTAVKRMQKLNVKYIRTMTWKGDGVEGNEWRKKAVERCKELTSIATDYDIILAHENCEGWGGLSAKNMVELKAAVDSPNFKLLYDLGNTISHGYEPWEFFQTIRGHFDYIHIKDAKMNPEGGRSKDYAYCGEGDAMLKEILNIVLNEDKYDGIISIEPHVAAIVHLADTAEVSQEEKFSSYVRYGRMLEQLIKDIKKMTKIIKFAIIGTGMIAERHAAALAEIPEAELYAIYDKNNDKARKFTKNYPVKVYSSFDELLNDPQLTAVTIATPTGVHKELAIPCAEAGKHILCEKPLDVTLEKADAIIDACNENNVCLSAVFQARFSDKVKEIKDAIDDGRFGQLTLCSAQVKWYRSQEYYDSAGWRGTWDIDGGGALMNQSIHIIDLLLYLAGEPEMVHAFARTMTHERLEVEDNACASIKFKNGALGVIEASTSCAPGFPRRLEISGEKGSVILEDDAIIRWQFIDEQPEDEIIRSGLSNSSLKSGADDPRGGSHEGHRRQLLDLVEAINNKKQPSIPGSEGRRAVELICGIYESVKTGKTVRFV